jgi:hypothetical protein
MFASIFLRAHLFVRLNSSGSNLSEDNFEGYMTRFCLRHKAFGLLKGWEQQGFGMVRLFVR